MHCECTSGPISQVASFVFVCLIVGCSKLFQINTILYQVASEKSEAEVCWMEESIALIEINQVEVHSGAPTGGGGVVPCFGTVKGRPSFKTVNDTGRCNDAFVQLPAPACHK